MLVKTKSLGYLLTVIGLALFVISILLISRYSQQPPSTTLGSFASILSFILMFIGGILALSGIITVIRR